MKNNKKEKDERFDINKVKEHISKLWDLDIQMEYLAEIKVEFIRNKKVLLNIGVSENFDELIEAEMQRIREINEARKIRQDELDIINKGWREYSHFTSAFQNPADDKKGNANKENKFTIRQKILFLTALAFNGNLEIPTEINENQYVNLIHSLIGGDKKIISGTIRNGINVGGAKESKRVRTQLLKDLRKVLEKLEILKTYSTENQKGAINEIKATIEEAEGKESEDFYDD